MNPAPRPDLEPPSAPESASAAPLPRGQVVPPAAPAAHRPAAHRPGIVIHMG